MSEKEFTAGAGAEGKRQKLSWMDSYETERGDMGDGMKFELVQSSERSWNDSKQQMCLRLCDRKARGPTSRDANAQILGA